MPPARFAGCRHSLAGLNGEEEESPLILLRLHGNARERWTGPASAGTGRRCRASVHCLLRASVPPWFNFSSLPLPGQRCPSRAARQRRTEQGRVRWSFVLLSQFLQESLVPYEGLFLAREKHVLYPILVRRQYLAVSHLVCKQRSKAMPICVLSPFQILTRFGHRIFKMLDALKNGFLF